MNISSGGGFSGNPTLAVLTLPASSVCAAPPENSLGLILQIATSFGGFFGVSFEGTAIRMEHQSHDYRAPEEVPHGVE